MQPLPAVHSHARAGLKGQVLLCPHGSAVQEPHLCSPFFIQETPAAQVVAAPGTQSQSREPPWHQQPHRRPFTLLSTSISMAPTTVMDMEAPYWHLWPLYRPSSHLETKPQPHGASCWIGANSLLLIQTYSKASRGGTFSPNTLPGQAQSLDLPEEQTGSTDCVIHTC